MRERIFFMKFNTLFGYCPVCGSNEFRPNNVKSMRCFRCGFVMYVNPSAAVAAFILNKKEELLICVRAKDPAKGTWDLPGGFVDDDESAEQAVQREIEEELGTKVVAGKYLFSLPNEYLYSGWTLPTLDMFYFYEVDDDFHPVPADDVQECFFMPLKQIDRERFGLKSIKNAVDLFLSNYK